MGRNTNRPFEVHLVIFLRSFYYVRMYIPVKHVIISLTNKRGADL